MTPGRPAPPSGSCSWPTAGSPASWPPRPLPPSLTGSGGRSADGRQQGGHGAPPVHQAPGPPGHGRPGRAGRLRGGAGRPGRPVLDHGVAHRGAGRDRARAGPARAAGRARDRPGRPHPGRRCRPRRRPVPAVSGAGAGWALAGRGLWAHRARLTLSVLAVVLGVAFIAGTLLLTDSLTAGIADLAPARATATVRSATTLAQEARPALPADLPGRLRRLEGVQAAARKVLGGVQLKPVTGSVKGPSLGLSWPEDAALSPVQLVAGRPPRPGEAAVSAGFAHGEQVRVGDAVQVATAQGS